MLDNRAIYLVRMARAAAQKQLDFLSYKSRHFLKKTQRSWKSFRMNQYKETQCTKSN